jgi:single-stranded-DNA-specific exonuclease
VLIFRKRTDQSECGSDQIKLIAQATGLCMPVAKLLCGRGVDTPLAAKRFLHPGPEQILDPFLLPDMERGVRRIKAAVACGEKIMVFCDYDADGTCGGCALYLHLKDMGADVDIMTPNRHKEGYGLSLDAVRQIAFAGTKLIITVDCGITNVEEIALAKSLGVDVIITDHHECGTFLPDTPYIINPKRKDSAYPWPYLAGCGVAFKLIHALSTLADAMRYIDLIAVGTITDIVPLKDENRVIAYLGLKKMRNDPSAGIAALAEASSINISAMTACGVSFALGPRINAAGRMDTAGVAIDILKATQTGSILRQNAVALCALNDQRKKEVEDILESAEAMICKGGHMTKSAIMLADEKWNPGVIGIAAAKIAEKYSRPCVLFGGSGDSLIGSARSVDGINIYEALGAFADRYEKFGGHAQAAGLTIKPDVLDNLWRDVCSYISARYDESAFFKKKTYDMVLRAQQITKRLVSDIERLEPFGPGNEEPCIAVMDADIESAKFVGKETKPHLKFVMRQGGSEIDAVSFFFKDMHTFWSKRCDFLCQATINNFNGKPQLIVRHTAMKYDVQLAQSYLFANRDAMMRHFINEIIGLCENGPVECMDEKAFSLLVQQQIKSSRFGLCIIAPSNPAIKRLTGLRVIKDALLDGQVALFDEKSFSLGNCIACGAVNGYSRLCHVGIHNAPAFFDGAMFEEYVRHAQAYFTPREGLLRLYHRLSPFAAKKPRTLKEVAHRLSAPAEKTAFALRVFSELKLIEADKSGRILATKNDGKKELRESACFKSFEDVVKGAVLWKN